MTPDTFTALTAGIAHAPRGVLFSEMYLFTAQCVAAGVTAICETGVASGVSTRLLRRLWPDVTSFDKDGLVIPADLKPFVTIADGRVAVPQWVSSRPCARLGVLIDGPKGPKGSLIRQWCLEQPQVRVVAQHDWPIGTGETLHSNDPKWREQVGESLDARVPASVWAGYDAHRRGLGVWVKP